MKAKNFPSIDSVQLHFPTFPSFSATFLSFMLKMDEKIYQHFSVLKKKKNIFLKFKIF